MEPLWRSVVATRGNRSQIASARNRHNQAKTVAVGCDRLPEAAHGKEGSPVRVRERDLQKRRRLASSRSDRLARSAVCGGYAAVYELSRFPDLKSPVSARST